MERLINKIVVSICEASKDEEKVNEIVSKITSGLDITENDFEHFRWGFVNGMTRCLEVIAETVVTTNITAGKEN